MDTNRSENYKKYLQYKENPDYTDVEYDEKSDGVKATHKEHNLDKIGGMYELKVQNAGFKAGHCVILGKERGEKNNNEKFTEGTWDDFFFEVAGRQTATANNVLKGLKHCASKQKTEIAILYYPNANFDLNILTKALARYKGLKKLNDPQYIEFKQVICIQNEEIVYCADFK